MGCYKYLSCFGNSNSKHPNNQIGEVGKVSDSAKQGEPNKKKLKEFLSSKSTKRVTFDLDIETCKELTTNVEEEIVNAEADQELVESTCQKELCVGEIAKDLVETNVENGIEVARGLFQSNGDRELNSAEVEGNGEKESEKEKEISEGSQLLPRNNRYENCSKDDESEGMHLEDADLNGDDDYQGNHTQGESSGSLFSLSIDSRKKISAAELGEKEVTSAMPKQALPDQEHCKFGVDPIARDRSENDPPVLNPVENLTQWKAVRASPTSPAFRHQEKENINLEQDGSMIMNPEPSFRQKSKSKCEEYAVNTSLSSWLVAPETSPMSRDSANSVRNSPVSPEDRPILGALTVGDLKFSASISPKRSRSKSPEDMPIIGTVGSYWRHTGQTVDSDSSSSCTSMLNTAREKKKTQSGQWNSIPFQERLEREVE